MAKSVFNFPTELTLVGTEFRKAFDGFRDKSGKEVKGKPARYVLSFLFGEKNEKTGLYVRAPIVVCAETSITVGGKITEGGEYPAILQSTDGALKIEQITGVEIMRDNDAAETAAGFPF